ncbi:MAG: glycosyltransferase family 4 protein [Ginsengibacter sp.]
MRILHLIYSSGIYGAEKHLLNLLPALKKYNIECDLIFICSKKTIPSLQEYCKQMNDKGIKTSLVLASSKVSFLLAMRKIFHYIKANNIRVVHSHLFSADLIAVLVKKIYFKKLVILSTKHGYEEKYLLQYGLGNKKINKNLYYFISRAVIRSIDHQLAVSDSLSKMYASLKLVIDKMASIGHGISLQKSTEAPVSLDGNPNIIIVGRLSEIKGHTYLLQALPQVIKTFPELKLIILGHGPLKDKLIKQADKLQIQDRIEFIGFANPQRYFPQCQLVVVTSLYESFGLVYIESFASRIPVVAFKTETASEIMEDNETGILVEKGNVQQLAEKIIDLLSNRDKREQIVENAYKKFEIYYNAERMAKETAEWYRAVLGPDEAYSFSE